MFKKGSLCSKEGKRYEIQIYNIVNKCRLFNGNLFNTQSIDNLGGCKADNDIECNWNSERDIPIEIKKSKTPDWMQCSIKYDENLNRWIGSSKNKIPLKAKIIFEDIIKDKLIFNGRVPPFMKNNITHKEWVDIKKETNDFNDMYFDCPEDTISKLYAEKGCKYIQISDKGLYSLGDDVCDFNVPPFICNQEIRVRTKIHTSKNSKGHCVMSVFLSCKPKNINELHKSTYSLDNVERLPLNLFHTFL